MKRTLYSHASLGFALILLLSLAGCKKSDNSSGNTTAKSSSSNSSSNSSSSSSSSSPATSSSSSKGSSDRFVGTWKPSDPSDTFSGLLVIKGDGTFQIKMGQGEGQSVSSSYVVSGDSLTLKDPEGKGDDAAASITDDGRLKVVDKSGSAEYFTKE